MRVIFKKALVIGSLLLSTTTHIQANNDYTDFISGFVPVLPIQEEECQAVSSKEIEDFKGVSSVGAKLEKPIDMEMVKKIAGKNQVFTLDTMSQVTDGSYILLRQRDLKLAKKFQKLQSFLQESTDIHVILDVEADSAGVLTLHSVVKTVEQNGSETRKRIFPDIKHLHLMNSAKNVIVIGKSFLYGDECLEDITFAGFETVERIEDGFIALCSSLQTADLSSFEHLKEIGSFFMSEDKGLKNLNLPTTTFFNADLTKVGDHFLRGAKSLTRVQEEALESVSHLGSYFMSESGVKSFDSGKFKKLKELGAGFLARCAELTTVDVSGLRRIVPGEITKKDVLDAETAAENAKRSVHANYKQAWSVSEEADRLEYDAEASEVAALKKAAQDKAIIDGIVAKGKTRAEAAGYPAGKVVLTHSEKARMYTARDRAKETLFSAQKALDKAKAAEAQVKHLKENAGHFKNLGVLCGCSMLRANPEAIRGAGSLKEALRNQLHLEYSGLTYDDGFWCF